MIVVTGAAGFIGSNIVAELEALNRGPIAVADWFGDGDKWRNLAKRRISAFVDPNDLLVFLSDHARDVESVIHMGAISATTERDVDRLIALNVNCTVDLWDWCAAHDVRFLYASSAATYGALETGLVDDEEPHRLSALRPLNAYGWSKKAVDEMIAHRIASGKKPPPQWAGLKFFNVYGPNEYHKGDMRSVVHKLFEVVRAGGKARLFKSYRPGIADGEQRRDFIYVRDCATAILWLLDNPQISGVFNLGTGIARSFLDITKALGLAMGVDIDFEFIDMPEQIRDAYQYYTQADMRKFASKGFPNHFYSLEDGVAEYVKSHLITADRYR